ncbi:MAG: WYL domain-containing protein [Ilumatobacteraceae bacterium]
MADRVERLTNLLALLLETAQPLMLVQIADELSGMYPEGAAARRGAFERDKAALREIGVPIESEVVEGGDHAGSTRYWIDRERYELSGLELEDDEVRALQVAVAATRPGTGGEGAQLGLWKLGAGAADTGVAVAASMPTLPVLPALRDAVATRSVVRFEYRSVTRDVEPYGLLLRDGFWYLVGFDRVRTDRRTFRVDRIVGQVEVGEPGAFRRPDIDVRAAMPTDPKLIGGADAADPGSVAVVRVDAARAASVVGEVGHDRVLVRHDDGSVEVAVACANLDAFRSWVLGLMEHARVVSPPAVRDHVRSWLVATAGESVAGGSA